MANIMTILIFVEYPFTEWDYDRWGIAVISSNGFNVEVWDFASWLHPDSLGVVPRTYPIRGVVPRIIRTKKDAQSALADLKLNVFIVNLVNYFPRSYLLYKYISANKLPYAVFMANALPPTAPVESGRPALTERLAKLLTLKPATVWQQLFIRCPKKILGVRAASIVLSGGEKSNLYRYPIDASTERLWAHTLDYDVYLRNKSASSDNSRARYFVFLDEYLPYHRDYDLLKMKAPVTAKEYYPALCRLFEAIEKNTGCHVIVAAHPMSDYEKHPDSFGGREVVCGRTAELVRGAECVIAHYSTAISFAVMYRKPVIFVTTNEIEKSPANTFIRSMSQWLGKAPINISNVREIDIGSELRVDTEAYQNYGNAFIKKRGSDELPFWQIFSNRMRQWQ